MARTFAFALFFLLFFVSAAYSLPGGNRYPISDTELRRKKSLCVENIDNGLWGWHCKSSVVAKENCALRCISAACYEKVYGEDPLEEGEIDFKRGQEFRYCVRRESLGESVTQRIYIDDV